jgi:chromosome partitioning protein
MPVIVFANPKGGSGKTTAALLLATELANCGARVTIIDADPERWISQWAALPGKPRNIAVINDVTEDSLVDHIEQAAETAGFVAVDLEGTSSLMASHAVGMADLVIIPIQGSALDAKGGAKLMRLIRNQEKLTRRTIPFSVVLTRTGAAIPSRSLKMIVAQLAEAGVDTFETPIVERAAFKDLFSFGGTLSDLDPARTSNIEKAIINARDFAGEVVAKLKLASMERAA